MQKIEHYSFEKLEDLVTHLRSKDKKVHLLFAYNSTGKTRLSMDFRQAGKALDKDGNVTDRDTLYFNAFTEDLFSWDNDLEKETKRILNLNTDSKFLEGLEEFEIENRIKPLLFRYVNFDFKINYEEWSIRFFLPENKEESIKISRGEERIFIWCFFLVIMQLAMDGLEKYNWVKYIYIDDPVTSLDDHNAISVAHHLAQMIKSDSNRIKTIISTHHALFFNVLCNEFKGARKLFLGKRTDDYLLESTTDSPFVYHVSLIRKLRKAIDEDRLYTYHFTILRTILEKAANFHGFSKFSDCIEINDDDDEKTLYSRVVNIMNHGSYSMFEPKKMVSENKTYLKSIFNNYLKNYKFNDILFKEEEVKSLI